jgi:hypothetical protein
MGAGNGREVVVAAVGGALEKVLLLQFYLADINTLLAIAHGCTFSRSIAAG